MNLAVVNLTGGGLSGGYRKYLECLAPLMARHAAIDRLAIFVPPGTEASLHVPDIPLHSWPSRDRFRGHAWLKQRISEMSPHVVFVPTAQCMDFRGIPVVNMVRNMEPLQVPFAGNPLPEIIKNVLRRHTARKAVGRADRVIAVSGHVRDFLVTRWQIDTGKVGVVYHGIDLPQPMAAATGADGESPLSNNCPEEFIFTAGSIRPARGLEDVVGALGHLKKKGKAIHLIVAGSLDEGMRGYRKKIDDLADTHGLRPQIFWAGPLTQTEMAFYYRCCRVFVMTSRAEACPNIALEAMAHGCVSVATDTPPMPEMFGPAAVYYPAKDTHRLAAEIDHVLSWEESRRTGISRTARERAGRFTWQRCVEGTVDELRQAVNTFLERSKK